MGYLRKVNGAYHNYGTKLELFRTALNAEELEVEDQVKKIEMKDIGNESGSEVDEFWVEALPKCAPRNVESYTLSLVESKHNDPSNVPTRFRCAGTGVSHDRNNSRLHLRVANSRTFNPSEKHHNQFIPNRMRL